jgi:alpha-tubulin suppressor-like RCC1 family protein
VAKGVRSYAVADTGKVWAWGTDVDGLTPLGHGEPMHCRLPEPIEALRGIKVDAVAAGASYSLSWADDGSVYTWGANAGDGALGLGPASTGTRMFVRVPQLLPGVRVTR